MSLRDKMSEEAECVEAIFLSYVQNKSSQEIFLFFVILLKDGTYEDIIPHYLTLIHS